MLEIVIVLVICWLIGSLICSPIAAYCIEEGLEAKSIREQGQTVARTFIVTASLPVILICMHWQFPIIFLWGFIEGLFRVDKWYKE